MTTGQLRYFELIFLTLPKQAVQFSLAGITPSGTAQHWSDNAVAYLKGKITGNCVRVKIVSATQTAFLVEMFDPDCTRKMLDVTMYKLGYAQYGQGKPPSTPLSSLRGVSLGQRRSSGLPGVCKVQVTDITDPWSFCVQEMDGPQLSLHADLKIYSTRVTV